MTFIKDGRGSGKIAGVNNNNRLMCSVVDVSIEHEVTHRYGQSYNLLFDVISGASDACIFYLQNTSTQDMILEGVHLYVSGATEIYIKRDLTGTRNAASAIVPINLNFGSVNAAAGVFEQGTNLGGGAATLGGATLTLWKWKFVGEKETQDINFTQDIVIPTGQTCAIYCSANTIQVQGILCFNYHNLDD